MVLRLARAKAQVTACVYAQRDDVVIAADTTVVIDGERFGKPRDAEDAEAILKRLRNRTHQVLTGIGIAIREPQARDPSLGILPHEAPTLGGEQYLLVGSGNGRTAKIPGGWWSSLCETRVHMRNYTDEEIQKFIASGEPFDKAGAYAIQDSSFHPVDEISGCYLNVMGLPLCHVIRGLNALGITIDRPEPVLHDCLTQEGQPRLISDFRF